MGNFPHYEKRLEELKKISLPKQPYFDWRKTNGRIPDSDDHYTNLFDPKEMTRDEKEDLEILLNSSDIEKRRVRMERIVIKLTNGDRLEFTGVPMSSTEPNAPRFLVFKKENGNLLYIRCEEIIAVERSTIGFDELADPSKPISINSNDCGFEYTSFAKVPNNEN